MKILRTQFYKVSLIITGLETRQCYETKLQIAPLTIDLNICFTLLLTFISDVYKIKTTDDMILKTFSTFLSFDS